MTIPRTRASEAGDAAVTMAAGAGDVDRLAGTPGYMSPEQARGAAVDRTADVWAFGCLLYELLTGRPAFGGATVSDTIAAVLEHEPDFSQLPSGVPGSVYRLLRRCLQKDPRQRFRDMSAVRILLEEALDGSEAEVGGASAPAPRPRRAVLGLAAGILAAFALGVAGTAYLRPNADTRQPLRLSIATPRPIVPQLSAATSPDGRQVAFVATDRDGQTRLWLRSLDSLDARTLPGTEGALHPFWSPDGRPRACGPTPPPVKRASRSRATARSPT